MEKIDIKETKLQKAKNEYTDQELKIITEQHITELNSDFYIYTDGSTSKTQENGGAGMTVYNKEGNKISEECWAAGKWCSSFAGECVAMIQAMEWAQRNEEEESRDREYSILTDSMSLVKWMKNIGNKVQEGWKAEICNSMMKNKARIKILWIPSHISVDGNEAADNQAKRGCSLNQDEVPIERDIVKAKIKKESYNIEHEGARQKYKERREPKQAMEKRWPRKIRVLYTRLRTNHSAELGYYQRKLNNEEEGKCRLCQEEEETSEHLVCECPGLEMERREIFLDIKPKCNVLVEDPERSRKILSRVFKELTWEDEAG